MDIKERLVVSNGSKCIERADEKGQWETYKVAGKGNLQTGVYPLHEAHAVKPHEKGQFSGTIIHADQNNVYQDQGDRGIARFDRHAFTHLPEIGRATTISFEYGRAKIVDGRSIGAAAAVAAAAAVDKRAQADGLSPAQRAIVAARVHENTANSVDRGHVPEVKIKEEVEHKQSRDITR